MDIFGLYNVVDYLFLHPSVVLMIFLIYAFIFALSVLFWGRKPGLNPFNRDSRRPREPLVTERKVRDVILKQRFKKSKIPDKLDAVIVGSGVGGLSTAALLARAGKRVLVLEQHDQAGGCCHTFKEKGFEFDTGIHYVGDMTGESMLSAAVEQLTDGQLHWEPMDDSFDVVALGSPEKAKLYPMKSGREQYYNNLISMFPEEEAAIKKYRAAVSEVLKSQSGLVILKVLPKWLSRLLVATGLFHFFFGSYFKYANKSLKSVLDGLTSNKELKCVLSYILGDYGLLPSEAPFSLHASLIGHYRKGAFYPDGGTSEISFNMVRAIEKYGSKVLVQAPVSKILFNTKGRAIGVTVAGEIDIHAKRVISDAGAHTTFKTLIPREIAQQSSYYSLLDKCGHSVSYITAFCGLSGTAEDLGMKSHNCWAYTSPDIDGTVTEFLSQSVDDAVHSEVPLMFVSFPSAKDPSASTRFPGKSSVLLITIAKWEWFSEWADEKEGHRGDRYDGLKKTIGRQMWKQTVSLYPQLDGQLEYMDVGTPVTNMFYLGAPCGQMYGMNHTAERFSTDTCINLRPSTGIPGLYMTGQDVFMVGFVSAVVSGMLTAGAILNRNLIKDLEHLRKSFSKNSEKKDN